MRSAIERSAPSAPFERLRQRPGPVGTLTQHDPRNIATFFDSPKPPIFEPCVVASVCPLTIPKSKSD